MDINNTKTNMDEKIRLLKDNPDKLSVKDALQLTLHIVDRINGTVITLDERVTKIEERLSKLDK